MPPFLYQAGNDTAGLLDIKIERNKLDRHNSHKAVWHI